MATANAPDDPRPSQLRQPRLAELVADRLRRRILSGELHGGDFLPKQEDLLAEFRVSKPSIREALRILETEGLITVQRGNVGGAVIHVPKARNAAYMLGLVLESKHVRLDDIAASLTHLEPVCAGMCASRPDRDEAVVARLRELNEAAAAAIDSADEVGYTDLARNFHEELVARCGNETMILVVGTLEALWSAHQRRWTEAATASGEYPDAEARSASLEEHRQLLTAIEQGDAERASQLARAHLQQSYFYAVSGEDPQRVSAEALH